MFFRLVILSTSASMPYTVQQLASLSGVSIRTLHYYDKIALLKPKRLPTNGYRQYGEKDLLVLQQILFFRELDFSLQEIKSILSAPSFDLKIALQDQKKLIALKRKRLADLISTIDKTISKLNQKTFMSDNELYSTFSHAEADQYAEEAKARWGNTKAYKRSQAREKKMSKADWEALKKKGDDLMKQIVNNMFRGPKSAEVQLLIAQHYHNLNDFYTPNLAIYRGLANLYIEDERFMATYEKYAQGLAQFMHGAMCFYCDTQSKKAKN